MSEIASTQICCQEDFQDFRTTCESSKAIFDSKRACYGFINTTESGFYACHNYDRSGQDSAKV